MARIVRGLLLVVAVVVVRVAPALAQTVTVTTTADPNDQTCTQSVCSLRDALLHSTADTIILPASSQHYVVQGEIQFAGRPLTIIGAGPTKTVIDAGGIGRIFDIYQGGAGLGPPITIKNVELTGGHAAGGSGGAILDDLVPLTLVGTLVDHNSVNLGTGSGGGGAIMMLDGTPLSLINSTLADNSLTATLSGSTNVGGGAADVTGPFTATGSHIDSNQVTLTGDTTTDTAGGASGGGGLLLAGSQPNSLSSTTVSGNTADITSGGYGFGGGGIFVGQGGRGTTTSLANSIIHGNTLTVHGSSVTTSSDNHCCSGGGGVYSQGSLGVLGGSIDHNAANLQVGDCCQAGGGVLVVGENTPSGFFDATVADNVLTAHGTGAGSGGGGLAVEVNPNQADVVSSWLTVDGSTFSGNQANLTGATRPSGGGAINLRADGDTEIVNSTLSGNTTNASGAGSGGGAILVQPVRSSSQALTLDSTTIAGNSALAGQGGGILTSGVPVQTENSILALDRAASGSECFTPAANLLTSLGYNLTTAPDSCRFTAAGDKSVAASAVHLGPLQSHGGLTQTRALLSGSPAIGGGNPAGCVDPGGGPLPDDQRGIPRPEPKCDIGAFEHTSSPAGPQNRALKSFLTFDSTTERVYATIASTAAGNVSVSAAYTTERSATPQPFLPSSVVTSERLSQPGVVSFELPASSAAFRALSQGERLTVTVVIKLTPKSGSPVESQRLIALQLASRPPDPTIPPSSLPAQLEVSAATSLSFVGGPGGNVQATGTILYGKAADFFGQKAVPASLADAAVHACYAYFNAKANEQNSTTHSHLGVKVYGYKPDGTILDLTTRGATQFAGNGHWARNIFPGWTGRPMIALVGMLDANENYVQAFGTTVKWKSWVFGVACDAASESRAYNGPHGR